MRIFRLIIPLLLTVAALVVATPAANATTDTFRFETGLFRVNTCNGDFVQTSGIVTVTTRSVNGELTAYITGHFTGTGGTSGTQYIANLSEKVNQVFEPFSFHQEVRTELVSKGSEPNLIFLATVDIDTNGNFTFEATSICHG